MQFTSLNSFDALGKITKIEIAKRKCNKKYAFFLENYPYICFRIFSSVFLSLLLLESKHRPWLKLPFPLPSINADSKEPVLWATRIVVGLTIF